MIMFFKIRKSDLQTVFFILIRKF